MCTAVVSSKNVTLWIEVISCEVLHPTAVQSPASLRKFYDCTIYLCCMNCPFKIYSEQKFCIFQCGPVIKWWLVQCVTPTVGLTPAAQELPSVGEAGKGMNGWMLVKGVRRPQHIAKAFAALCWSNIGITTRGINTLNSSYKIKAPIPFIYLSAYLSLNQSIYISICPVCLSVCLAPLDLTLSVDYVNV